MIRHVLLAAFLAASCNSFADTADYESVFKCNGEEKFNWYCEQAKLKKEKPKEFEAMQAERERKIKAFDLMSKDLEDTRKIAIMDPSPENLKEYISKQLEVQNKAAIFTDVWKRVQWANPELDYSTRFGMSTIARQESDKALEKNENETLKKLSDQGWGMLFFYRSDCPFCHRMVPSINLLSKNGMAMLPVTLDGKTIDSLEMKSEKDNGQAAKFNVKQVPTVVLVNTKTKQVLPIASGTATYSEIKARTYVITQTKPGDNY